MKYSRTEIDASAFSSIFTLEGATFYQRPKLPKFEFRANKVDYTISDIRLLHPLGVQAVEKVLETVMKTHDCEKVSICVEELDEDEISIVTDILMGMEYSAMKRGKNGFEMGGIFLITGVSKKGDILTCYLAKPHAKAIYEYAQKNLKEGDPISFCGLACAVTESAINEFKEVYK